MLDCDECPLCKIPEREFLLFENDLVYLVRTKNLKGHTHRVMVCIKRHSPEPTFEERTLAYAVLYDYMNRVMEGEPWFIVGQSRHTSYPSHWHLIASDNRSHDPEEMRKLHESPRVIFPPFNCHKRVLIGIPAFNEERHIGQVVWKASQFGDVVVVDDGSTDQTGMVARYAGAEVLRNERNMGYGFSHAVLFQKALSNPEYQMLIILDADGQHNPDEIPLFVKAIDRGADVALGVRFPKSKVPLLRSASVKFVSKLVNASDAQCGFRAYSRRALETLKPSERGFGASLEIIKQAHSHGLKVVEVSCTVTYEEKPKRTLLKHGLGLFESFLWVTVWKNPLKYTLPFSGLSFFLGIFFSSWLIAEYQRTRWFPLSLSILSLGSLLFATILLVAGVLVWSIKKGISERIEL